MKKYRVVAQSMTGEGEKHEYIIEAINEEMAKETVLNLNLKDEFGGVFLDSPAQLMTVEEIDLEPHKITDLIDNIAIYIEEMRLTEDTETIPKKLVQFAFDYLKNVEFNKEHAKNLAIFGIDKTYRVVANLEIMDKYTRVYFATVLPYLWGAIQNQNINIFYILDNTFSKDGKFEAVVELFELMDMVVITPYSNKGVVEFEEVKNQIEDNMKSSKMIVYIEKDTSVNYLDGVQEIASNSTYLSLFRNQASNISQVALIDSNI